MNPLRCLPLLTVCVVCMTGQATAFEFVTTHGLGMGETAMLSRSSASSLVSLPAGGIKPGEWLVETGYSRRFEMRDLDRPFVAAAYRRQRLSAAVGLSQFGRGDLYAEKTLKSTLVYQLDSVSVGVSLSGMMVDIGGGYGGLRAATFGLGAAYRSGRWFVAIAADNLTSPRLAENSVAMEPVYSLYGELIGKGSFSVTGRATLQDCERPQYGLGQWLRLSGESAFFWGISTAPLEFGGGIELHILDAAISYATSVHPVLGFSHTIAVAYRSHKSGEQEEGFD